MGAGTEEESEKEYKIELKEEVGKFEAIESEINLLESTLRDKEKQISNVESENAELSGRSKETMAEKEKLKEKLELEKSNRKKIQKEKEKLIKERNQQAHSILTSDYSSSAALTSIVTKGHPIGVGSIYGDATLNEDGSLRIGGRRCRVCENLYYDDPSGLHLGLCPLHRPAGFSILSSDKDSSD